MLGVRWAGVGEGVKAVLGQRRIMGQLPPPQMIKVELRRPSCQEGPRGCEPDLIVSSPGPRVGGAAGQGGGRAVRWQPQEEAAAWETLGQAGPVPDALGNHRSIEAEEGRVPAWFPSGAPS